MKDVGFKARNLTGFAVIFESPTNGHGRSVFQKSHPIAKIDVVMLRAMGKRMSKWFGWQRNSFVLESS